MSDFQGLALRLAAIGLCAWLAACSNAASSPGAASTLNFDAFVGSDVKLISDTAAKAGDTAASPDVPDAAQADGAAPAQPDAVADVLTTCPGAAGCSCSAAADCGNALCIDTPDGKRCAANCTDSCAAGFSCATLAGGVKACVPSCGKVCQPCNASKDCDAVGIVGALCLDEGALGRFCGAPCQGDVDCPGGYACLVGQSPEGPKGLQCIRSPSVGSTVTYGTCPCTQASKAVGASTQCYAEQHDSTGKVVGQCAGTRTCGPIGLGNCTLVGAKAEVCDGVDNDCNGQIDEKATGCSADEMCVGGKCTGGGCGDSCDTNATCSGAGAGGKCVCNPGFTGNGTKGACLASCKLPWGDTLASGGSVLAYQTAAVACGANCSAQTLTCSNGKLDGGDYGFASCSPAACPGNCPGMTVTFDWGVAGSGPCHLDLPAGKGGGWYYTKTTDDYLGGLVASCDDKGTWQFSAEKCVPRGTSTTCFVKGTKCDGSGPASFPYPHCWTCCNPTAPVPGTCN